MTRVSIITVNYNSYDFIKVMIDSLKFFASEPYELIVIDNSNRGTEMIDTAVYGPLTQIVLGRNLGHGCGLNIGAREATSPYVLFLDADCHFLRSGWENKFIELIDDCDVVGGRGVPVKPIRPSCTFLRKEVAQYYDWRDTPGYDGHINTPEGLDVAINAYYQMVDNGMKIKFIDATPSGDNRYGTLTGEEWCLDGEPYIYHHWHGTHLKERSFEFPGKDLFAEKEKLFAKLPWKISQNFI
jgi:glycosyltransferase involved in cell wall biosynthesis